MNTEKPRVRFAPSPTGFLHIGGARTALFNYLFARHHGGSFVLRVEDTDRERSTPEAVEAILDGLRWLGLDWDEGPFFQSERNELYRKHLEQLVAEGKAYRCYCTQEELKSRREKQMKEGGALRYDRRCRELVGKEDSRPYVLRFKVPEGATTVHDLVKGDTTFNHDELEDVVLARSDGTPTYNFVVVVDDVEMKISHVIRGDDHLNNTPKQILLYQAIGAELPTFAHLPLILGEDRQRLSKRHGATSVQAYREMGYLPHALVNFLARLGWSCGDQEIFSPSELIEKFNLESVGTSAGVFNAEKLLWLNQHYIKHENAEVLLAEICRFIEVPEKRKTEEGWKLAIDSLRERSKTTKEMAELSRFYFLDELTYDEKAVAKFLTPQIRPTFEKLRDLLQSADSFDEATFKPKFQELLQELDMKMGKLAQPLRVALVGGTASPSIFEVLTMLGKERVVQRVDAALQKFMTT